MKVVEEAGDSENFKAGQIVSPRELRDENSILRRADKNWLKLVMQASNCDSILTRYYKSIVTD